MEEKLIELKKKEENIKTKFFFLSFKIIFIFAIPAFLALFGGKALDKEFGTGKTITLILLALAFISSWILVFYFQRKLVKELRENREEIKKSL